MHNMDSINIKQPNSNTTTISIDKFNLNFYKEIIKAIIYQTILKCQL